jgi:hypothetical protein
MEQSPRIGDFLKRAASDSSRENTGLPIAAGAVAPLNASGITTTFENQMQ